MRLIFILLIFFPAITLAQTHYQDSLVEKSEAPYFYTGKNDYALPLLKTETAISIDSVIADIHIKQFYRNDSSEALEAVYTFPASTYAAVYKLTIQIEDRTIEAEVQEKNKARKSYEQAKQEGKSAALLEQEKPNVFTMNVANILPGETIEVDLHYTELLQRENNVYELVYPLSFDHFNPSGKASKPSLSAIDIHLNTAVPFNAIVSPSHNIEVLPSASTQASVTLDENSSAKQGDFVLRYQVADSSVQTGLQLFEGEDENYFFLQVEPPERIESSMVLNREYIFVIDTSGSMNGFPMDVSKTLILELLNSLNSDEKFNVVFFAGGSQLLSKHSLDANSHNIEKLITLLDNREGAGSTDLLQALKTTSSIPHSEGYTRSVITITDGFIHAEGPVFEFIDKHLSNTNYFAFGIGSSVNRHLMEVIARAGYGEAYVALNHKEAKERGKALLNTLRYPLLSHIGVDFGNFNAYDVQPIVVSDLFAAKPITISGKWQGPAEGQIKVSGINATNKWEQTIPLAQAQKLNSRSLEYIWARKEIQQHEDYLYLNANNESIKQDIIDLGLKHNLLTQFTSFVAIDNHVRTNPRFESSLVSNGFAIPVLSVNVAGLPQAIEDGEAKPQKKIGAFTFQKSGIEWVDCNHNAVVPVFQIGYNSEIYKILIKKHPELSTFTDKDIVCINLGNISIQLSAKAAPLDTNTKNIVRKALNTHEAL